MLIYNFQTYILLFFIYSFAGWFMESVGGILNVKKFVNRGFLIGPYCPVYGCGVILITILLQKYSTDIPALFFLSTLICGTLEYATSYYMEKCFNARWWDYTNRKFNINGRICLETLLPFGIGGTLILCYINPFIVKYINLIPINILNILSYGLVSIFIIDIIFSFVIINSFKDETYKLKDNTEEVSNKVKEVTSEMADKLLDKTEDALMKAESNIIVLSRNLKVKGLKFERKVSRYTSKKRAEALKYTPAEFIEKLRYSRKLLQYKINQEKEELNQKIKYTKDNMNNLVKEHKQNLNIKIKDTKANVDNKLKESKINLNNRVSNIKLTSEERTKQIRERMKEKSIFHRRLVDAFPNLETKVKIKAKKQNK